MSATATIPVVVRSVRDVATGIRAIELCREDGLPLPPFSAGAHIDLHLSPNLVRPYSLCGPSDEPGRYTVAVKLEPRSRGGSRAVHEQIRQGARLRISMPRNLFALDERAGSAVLVAGGIGITPLLCMARRLARLGRPFQLHYFARSEEHAAFRDVLRGPGFERQCTFHFGLDHGAAAAALRAALGARCSGAQLYLCGPRAFMDTVCTIAGGQGWPPDCIHLEHFNAGGAAQDPADMGIRVRLARSGITVAVAPGVPIVDAVRAAGVAVDTSCEQGVCGTCVTPVLEGIPEHRDLFLSDAEKARGDCIAICVSRAATPHLVLDL